MLWTVNHVLNTESEFEKLAANSYALALQNVWYDKVMCERPGKGAKQEFEFLLTTADIYRLNSKGDGLRFDDLVTQAHSVTHEDCGAALEITRNQFEDDAFGFSGDWMQQMGSRMALDPQYEAVRMIQNGETLLGYDGLAFYSKLHPVNPFDSSRGTYPNLVDDMNDIDSTIANATAPDLSVANLAAAIAHIKSMKMPNGKNRNLVPKTLRVGPKLEKRAREITSAGFIGATENVIRQYQLELLIVNEITGYEWDLDCTVGETPGLLPFVRFVRRAYEMTSYNGMTQVTLGRSNKLEWQIRGRYGYMYGHPYQSYRFKGVA